MSDSLKKFSEVLRCDFGWNQERIDQFLTSLDCNFKRFDYDAKKVEQYVDSLSKIHVEWEQFILRTMNGEILTANASKHIYVPGVMIPSAQGPTGPTGPPGTPGQPGTPTPYTWTGVGGGGVQATGTTGTSGTTSNSYTSYFTAAGSGSTQIGSVTVEGDGEEKIPSFEGDVEGIVEIEEDED